MLLFDSHLDIAWNATEWGRNLDLEVEEIRRSEDSTSGPGRRRNTVSFPELRKAEVGIFIGTFLARRVVDDNPPFAPFPSGAEAASAVGLQYDFYAEWISKGVLNLIDDSKSLRLQIQRWKTDPDSCPLGMILSMEGADPIMSVEKVAHWKDRGLSIIGPAHYGENRYTHGTSTKGGLKAPGYDLLSEMEAAGIILDITHLTDQAFDEALDFFGGPVLASHHNCRALVPDQRQLSDPQILKLIERNSVIGIAFDAWMLTPGWERGKSDPSGVRIEAAVDHIDHICQLAGNVDHVGIGSDLDGGFGTEQCPGDLETIADLQKLVPLLKKRGYGSSDIEAIFYRNWVRFFERSL